MNTPAPTESDKRFYVNGRFDEDAFTEAYLTWEAEVDAHNAREREEREREEAIAIANARANPPRLVIEETSYTPAPLPSKDGVVKARQAIGNYLKGQDFSVKQDAFNLLEKLIKPVATEVEKIRIHCDYKEKIQLTTAEEKKVEALRSIIASTDLTIEHREKQVADSETKIQRIDDQISSTEKKFDDDLERLRLEYETKVKAIETKRRAAVEKLEFEKKKSQNYAEGVKLEIRRLESNRDQHVAKIDEKINPKVKLTMTDYTKLRQLKTKQLEHAQAQLDVWFSYHKMMDEELEQSLESYHGKAMHKIDEDELVGITWLRDRFDYESLFTRLSRNIKKQLADINNLLDHSEAEPSD